MPTALVTGAPEWVPHVAIALESEGFDVVSTGTEETGRDIPPHAVMVLIAAQESPADHPAAPPRSWRSYLDEDPDLGYADWRDEVLCLTSAR